MSAVNLPPLPGALPASDASDSPRGRPGASSGGEEVLLLEHDRLVRLTIAEELRRAGFLPLLAEDLAEARGLLRNHYPALYVLDIRLPDGSGVSLLKSVREADPDVPILMITGQGSVKTAVELTRLGATDYIAKPFDPAEFALVVRRALERSREQRELRHHREQSSRYGEMAGQSPPMMQLFELLRRLEASDSQTVLIQGESGTGKELVARAIHGRSSRSHQPFVEVDCTGLDEQLAQSTLFGHERGAFTDAKQRKAGLFEVAGTGTILLDEIGELGLQTQSKLLRALENRRFKRVGGLVDVQLKARVLAATNRDLPAEVAAGRFREDLYYRLAVIVIQVPPLRQRLGDIPLLADRLIGNLARHLGRSVPTIDDQTMGLLRAYSWPGNVRELRNVLERALILHNKSITPADLPREFGRMAASEGKRWRDGGIVLPVDGLDLADVTASLVVQALERTEGNKSQAAKLLGISRFALRTRIQKLDLG